MKKLYIKGVIISNDYKRVYDWFGMESTCPNDVLKFIEAQNGQDIEVNISSDGGMVYAGSEIYTMLKSYEGNVTVNITGRACSSASVIAMAGSPVKIAPTAQIMIHNVSVTASGDHNSMEETADLLKNFDKSISNAYVLKTGLSSDEILALMEKETWLNAQQAKEKGFVDEIMFASGGELVASFGNNQLLPKEVVNKVRNEIAKIENQGDEGLGKNQVLFNLLKMKEVKL